MRLLLVQDAPFFPSHSGASKSDRVLMNHLARSGHECRVIARIEQCTPCGHSEYLRVLGAHGIAPVTTFDDGVAFALEHIEVHVVTQRHIRRYIAEHVDTFKPHVVMVSTDPLNVLIFDLTRSRVKHVIYMARTTTLLPFGPQAAFPSDARTDAIRQASAVVAVSQYLADYIKKHSGIVATASLPIQFADSSDWPHMGGFNNEFVTMVNPCGLKGISILMGVADRLPEVAFAVVPTWGTTTNDRIELARRSNIHVLVPCDDIRSILKQTRVTLVPSLWPEARARIILESMLGGVPVIASDVGGNREATMGIGDVIPVRRITEYERRVDERGIRIPVVPTQDVEPWVTAVRSLTEDRGYYDERAQESREAAHRYIRGLDPTLFELFLEAHFSGTHEKVNDHG